MGVRNVKRNERLGADTAKKMVGNQTRFTQIVSNIEIRVTTE